MKISYSFGIMDLFHYGHLKALEQAAEGADLHVCGLLSDVTAKAWLGSVVSTERERKAVLESIRCIDWVMPQQTLDPTENLKKLHYIYPEATITLFRGDDIAVLAASAYLKQIGGRVEFLDYYARLSPMAILETLTQRNEQFEKHTGMVSTKANTLLALQERVKYSRVEPIHIVLAHEFVTEPKAVAERIRKVFKGIPIVVRSSSQHEDSFDTSNAGHYESVLSVDSGNIGDILDAVGKVYASYAKDGQVNDDEQILIQPQTTRIKYSGVVFTSDIQRNRPYYVINYDDSGATDSVTSGIKGKTIWMARDIKENAIPEEWKSLFAAVRELEGILRGMLLDIEFAVKHDGEVVLFQVRPLAASYKLGRSQAAAKILEQKACIQDQYVQRLITSGNELLSDMAFWNPAEIIGDNPHPLDYSLYREIITHRAWNEGLVSMGYCTVVGDLMYRLGNKPYISIEKAFHSLIPASLPEALIAKLEDFYIRKFRNHLSAHDKIEFEIVFSCYDFATETRLQELQQEGFSAEEIQEIQKALRTLTQEAIINFKNVLRSDLSDLECLERIRRDIEDKLLHVKNSWEMADLVSKLLAAVKTYGTPQFARQARYAFIAKALAVALKTEGFWTSSEYDAFMQTLHTVSADFEEDFHQLLQGVINERDFNEKYGHLRAGTYDITASRYDQMTFTKGRQVKNLAADHPIPYDINCKPRLRLGNVDAAVTRIGLNMTNEELVAFLRQAMEQREYFKFCFTKSLSRAIEIISDIGKKLNIPREEMAFLDIQQIFALHFYDDTEMAADFLREAIAERKKTYALCSQIILPSVITEESNLTFIRTEERRPNFITEQAVYGETVLLDAGYNTEVTDKIVLAEKADPGYDWIFAHGIKGFVTKYGGVASHMAIRCAEFGIPAAIGCGERLFSFAKRQKHLFIDAKREIVAAGQGE